VRLDHLLSKEHTGAVTGSPVVRVQSHISSVRLEVASSLGGALVIRSECQLGQVSTCRIRVARDAWSRGAHGPSTLLGPEGTAASWSSSAGSALPQARMGGGDRDRPFLENCTVDASIICSCQVDKGTR
jgi:hypothetical protein